MPFDTAANRLKTLQVGHVPAPRTEDAKMQKQSLIMSLPSPFEVEAEREMLSLRLIIGPMNTQVLRRYVRLQAQVTAEQELEGKLFRHAVGDLKQ